MRKIFTIRILLLSIILPASFIPKIGIGQIVAWNNNSLSGITAGNLNATTNNANLNTSILSRGTGIVASSLTGGYASNTWTDVNQAGAITNNRYYQCIISASTNFLVSLSTLDSKLRRSGTGPNAYIWRFSTDGTNFTDIGTVVSFTTTTTTGDVQPQINLSGITALQNVASGNTITLRLYAWGATGAPGTLAFGTGNVNSLAFGGSVVSAISSNADLSNLSLSTGVLSPVFASATTSYTASVANGVTSITVTPIASNINSTITVNGSPVTSGNASASIALNVGANTVTTIVTAQDAVTTKTYTVTVTRAAAGVPTLSVTASLPDFGTVCINTITNANSFKITGTDLDGSNIALAALPDFTYCETAGGSYTTTLSFSYTAPGFTDKEIFVKFNPTAVQSYNGDISLSGGAIAANLLVPAAGTGINTSPAVTTGGSSVITPASGTAAGTINVVGCSAITAYGIEYSTNSGFADGTGTKINASNLSAGNYSVNLTGLAPNTRYYYKAYATNNGGISFSYGTQQAFTCLPLPVPMSIQPALSYTQNFSDVGTWGDFFTSGNGANHFGGLSANATGTIPDGIKITASTTNFNGSNFTSSGGVHRFIDMVTPTQSIIFLSTGSPDNTTSAALDFYMDFTGVNAGTLSFDYATINNSTGDRNGSLRVYATTNGITFTELPFADVLNFTNNVPISGSKTNIALPATFNNSPTARLRFYYHNGSGNTGSGSRPKISIDNLNVTAVATTPCVSPTAPATALTFGTITDVSIQAGFTAASPASDGYMVVMSTNNALIGNPIDGVIYNIGDNVGDGSVVANGSAATFTASSLTALTTYYFFVFPVNNVCTGGPLYYNSSVLNGSATTIAGLPPCAAPASQPTNLIFGTTGTNSIQASFTATTTDEYLVLRSTSSTLTNTPVNTQVYIAGDILGNAVVVQRNISTSFTANSLLPNTQYYFFIFSINSLGCINGPVYNIVSPLNGTQTTQPLPACAVPSAQPTSLSLTASNTAVSGSFTGVVDADAYLVVRSISSTLAASPVDNTDYNVGDNLGGGIVAANSGNASFLTTNLTANTTYYFFVFAANKNCSGGTKYFTSNPLTGNITTTNTAINNYYFGSLHAHSDYSDGNKDNPGFTPTDDYAYAKNSLCMDYLGISEHNHYSGGDPGNLLSTYHLGATEANTFTTNNPGFLALYGMEWGTISGGGHVLVYGNGMDDLWGWESGSGVWGASNNYDIYVPKSVYTSSTGLFKTVNDNIATNTFASLAHPNLTDFNNIANIAYDVAADNAITATTVESGPSSSTNTTYSAPGSSMGYLWYYQMLLAKGYHLGPTIDHDNHYTTFGRTTYSRTAIIAPSLTKAAMVNAIRNMNFYATQDCDSKVDFTINTKIMGAAVVDRFAPNISVTLTDATTATAAAIIRVMYGAPGSGILAVKIDSVIGNTLTFSDNNLANLATGYYYIDITNGSSRIVTSPIWYTRNDNLALPVKLSSFLVQKIDNTAKISWSTEQENNSSYFIVERSADGSRWNSIATVNAAGNSTRRIEYSIYDNTPMKGINYYRLKQVDKDAKYDYSVIRTALFNAKYAVEVAPNPAKDMVNIYLAKTNGQPANIQLLNASGKIVYTAISAQSHVQINTTGISKGLYFVKVIAADEVTVIRVLVQ